MEEISDKIINGENPDKTLENILNDKKGEAKAKALVETAKQVQIIKDRVEELVKNMHSKSVLRTC